MVKFFNSIVDDAHWVVYPEGAVVLFDGVCGEGFLSDNTLEDLLKEVHQGIIKEVTPENDSFM